MPTGFRGWAAAVALGLALASCTGTTKVYEDHYLYASQPDADTVRVYLLGPSLDDHRAPREVTNVHVAGGRMAKVARGEYCVVRLQPYKGVILFDYYSGKFYGSDHRPIRVSESMPVELLPGRTYFIALTFENRSPSECRLVPRFVSEDHAAAIAAELEPIGTALAEPIR